MVSSVRFLARALLALTLGLGAGVGSADAADGPGIEALDQFRQKGKLPSKAIENRFFLKKQRFELAPFAGYVPNNPFARRYVGGVVLAYHFTEEFAAEANISYSPDLGESDLKGLTTVLIDRAHNASAGGANFQQPLDKVTLAAMFCARWAPVYGKINLVGETVLNFDLYGVLGGALLTKSNYNAKYDEANANLETGDILILEPLGSTPTGGPVIGVGMDFFLTQFIALKIDARVAAYFGKKPQYNPAIPVNEQRMYTNFITGVGVSFFIPQMKPRLYDF